MKLCRTCRYGRMYELDKPCIVYRADCPLYEKEGEEMTREEAIGHIKDVICENNTIKPNIVVFEQEKEALYMAIKALEHPEQNVVAVVPCGDAISRQAVEELYYKDGYIDFHKICELPSIHPQEPKWIPISERLPEEDDFYLVTAKVGNELIIDISEYTPKNDFWDIPHEIVAWLPLPKPYKAESEPQESEEI